MSEAVQLTKSPGMMRRLSNRVTSNSSRQESPDGLRGREFDLPPPFELPESIVTRKSSQSAMSEAVQLGKSPGLIRRLSNRASHFTNRRRQSSTTAMSRDNSSGPVILRRRSDSTNTAPEGGKAALFADSDDEYESYREENTLLLGLGIEGAVRDFPSTTASISSAAATSSPGPGPVIPAVLLQGTCLTKVTKKKKKLLTFVLENEAAKVSWDKNRPSKSFYIDDIKDIRVGTNARNYSRECGVSDIDEPRFFSILYAVPDKSKGRAQKVMHLIANDEQTFDLWTTTLDAISKHRQDLMASLSSFHEKAVKTYWRTEMSKQFHDKPHSEVEEEIDIVGVERLCRSLHIHGSSDYFRQKFTQADVTRSGRLNFTEFQEFVKLMKRREDVRSVYQKLAPNSEKGMTLQQFLTFLKDTQGEEIHYDRAHWENVFAKFVRRSKSKEQASQDAADGEIDRMTEAALTSYLISTFNVPLKSLPAKYSLDRPLNEYFITSSHNTYLLGRQVAGQSSVEAYISALNQGCRCVEVDCWNGGDGQPVVMHGRTLTSQVSFVDVMSTISKYAFVKSPYPLWISLEVHCNPVQQALMAQIIKDTCGSKLVTEPIDSSAELPSPSQLLHRILIKVKKPRLFEAVAMTEPLGRSRGNSLKSVYPRDTQVENSTVPGSILPPLPSTSLLPQLSPIYYPKTRIASVVQLKGSGSEGPDSGISSSTSDSEGFFEDSTKPNGSTSKTSNIIKVLGELGVYSAGLKFRGFDTAESKAYNHIFSFMENTFDKNSKTQEERRAITRHNMRYLMRVYPNGWRVASTNFDPLKYWRRGVQMVALNWQTYDLGMQLNEAMFASGTDQSGYVLKPTDLREIKMITTVPEEAGAGHIKRERKNVNFSIEVISAQQLMRPRNLGANRTVDPYVEVEVYHADDKSKQSKGVVGDGGLDASSNKDGASGLGSPHRRRTHIVQENGFNPLFEKKFNFELTTKYPDLVFVRWTVRCSPDGICYSDKVAPLATYTAKLSSLKQGYRTLPLMDGNGDKFLFSTLFCRIKIEPATSIYVNGPEASESVGVFKRVFNRTPISPRIDIHQ
jgi:phosphatidylinositol phospholipase C delta